MFKRRPSLLGNNLKPPPRPSPPPPPRTSSSGAAAEDPRSSPTSSTSSTCSVSSTCDTSDQDSSPPHSLRVIHLDSGSSLVLKQDASPKPSILNLPQTNEELSPSTSTLSEPQSSLSSRRPSVNDPPLEAILPFPPDSESSLSSRQSGSESPRVNFAPLPQTRSRSGSASYGVNARAAMLFSNRSRRSSVPEVASDSDPKPHPADLQFGALPDIPDEVVQFDDEDRYALDDSDSSPTEDRDHVPDNAFVTENKLWLALQNRSSSRRRSSTTSTLQSASSIGSSYSGSALALGPEEDAPFSY